MKRVKQILPILFFSVFIQAKGQNEVLEMDTLMSRKIDEITITAFRAPYNVLNVPAPVNVISSLQFQTGNTLTTVEALNQISGVLMHSGTLNTNRLTIRGIGARTPYATNKIKAYFGDIPLTSGDGETTLEDLENSAISRAEIIKGPSSSLFGAGLAGVVLFYPEAAEKDFVRNQSVFGSFGTFKNVITAGINGNKLNLFALGSALKSNGYRENNETHRYNILMNADWKIATNTQLLILLKATKMEAFIPSSLDSVMFAQSPEKAAPNWQKIQGNEEYSNGQAGVTLNFNLQNFQRISASTFGSYRQGDELRPFNKLSEKTGFIGWRAYYQKTINGGDNKFVFSSGFEFFREKYNWSTFTNNNGPMLSDNQERRQYENLFFQLETNIKNRYFLSAGLNGNLTRFYYTDSFIENGDQSGNQNYQPVLSPRLGMNFRLNKNISLFGNVSHGFSTPTFEETLLPAGEINPDIKPETGWSVEAGFRTQWTNRIRFSASYYRIYIKNLLVARRTGEDAYVGVNAGKSEHPGFEAEFRWFVTNPENYPSLVLNGTATFANYHFTEFTDLNNDYSGNRLPGTAKTTWFASTVFNVSKNLNFNLWHRFTGKMPVNDANSSYSDPAGITNLEGKFITDFNKVNFEFKAGIQNIFDIHYASMLAVNAPAVNGSFPRYFYPGNPRNYFVSIIIGL